MTKQDSRGNAHTPRSPEAMPACSYCHGTGRLPFPLEDGGGFTRCDFCKGTGRDDEADGLVTAEAPPRFSAMLGVLPAAPATASASPHLTQDQRDLLRGREWLLKNQPLDEQIVGHLIRDVREESRRSASAPRTFDAANVCELVYLTGIASRGEAWSEAERARVVALLAEMSPVRT